MDAEDEDMDMLFRIVDRNGIREVVDWLGPVMGEAGIAVFDAMPPVTS